MEVLYRQHQVIGKRSVAVDNAERAAIGAMGRHTTLAISAIWVVAGSVNLTNDTLPDKVSILFLGYMAIDSFHHTHKLMTRNTLKIQIATGDFQVGVADTGKQDADKSFAINWRWHGIIAIKHQASFPAY